MSVCRPARCLFSKATSGSLPKAAPSRSFHASAPRPARRRRPHYPSIKAEDLALLNQAAEESVPKFTRDESKLLRQRYTPQQMEAIKMAERAIDPRDVVTQGAQRTDFWRLPYEDDLSEVDPVTDHAEKLDASAIRNSDFTYREMNEVERRAAMARIANETLAKLYPNGIPEGELSPTEQEKLEDAMDTALAQASLDPRALYYTKSESARRAMVDPRHSVILPDLPRLTNPMAKQTMRLSTQEQDDPRRKRLLQQMGWEKEKLRGIRTKTLVVHGVVNQTRMGKIRSMYYLTIAGNGDGLLGVGEGKSVEPEEGRKQSIMSAIRNMRPVPRYEGRTIYGSLERKIGATKVQLFSRPPGFGLRVQHLIFELARAAGLQDLSARTPRSRNKMNVIKATWEALTSQKLPDEIARGRGKKLVDVRKVYYGGSVH